MSFWDTVRAKTKAFAADADRAVKEAAAAAQAAGADAQRQTERFIVEHELDKKVADGLGHASRAVADVVADFGGPDPGGGGGAADEGPPPPARDVTYVTERVVAMGFPHGGRRDPRSRKGGNHVDAVSALLAERHPGHYMVWNVSEETYDYSKFDDQVLEYKFPGHPAPPLGMLFKIVTSIESWLDADTQNVACVRRFRRRRRRPRPRSHPPSQHTAACTASPAAGARPRSWRASWRGRGRSRRRWKRCSTWRSSGATR